MNSSQAGVAVTGSTVDDPAAWTGHQLNTDDAWRFTISDAQAVELIAMARRVHNEIAGDLSKLLDLDDVALDLGSFRPTCVAMYASLKRGRGLALLRGLPVQTMAPEQVAIVYWAIGRALGTARSNNPQGDMLGHVTDLGKDPNDVNSRGYQSRARLDWHCDQSDIVGLICVRPSKSGGESRIASAVTVYNTLLETDPDAAHVLSEPLCWSRHGEIAEGEAPWYESPVFSFEDGRFSCAFGPRHILKGHQLPGAPELPESTWAAIKQCETIADQHHYAMDFAPGDMQFLNNHVILHTRTRYTDWPELERRRLLYRLWLMRDDIRPRTPFVRNWNDGVSVGESRIVL